MTNNDKINAMTPEEKAELFEQIGVYPCKAICSNLDRCMRNNAPEPVCKRHYLDWLQEETEKDYSMCPYWAESKCTGFNCCAEEACPHARISQPTLFEKTKESRNESIL